MTSESDHTEPPRTPPIPPEKEPEYVGAHSGLPDDQDVCDNWSGETRSTVTQCGNSATHTVVMYDGELHEIPMCDDCGEPADVTAAKREWSASQNYERR